MFSNIEYHVRYEVKEVKVYLGDTNRESSKQR